MHIIYIKYYYTVKCNTKIIAVVLLQKLLVFNINIY